MDDFLLDAPKSSYNCNSTEDLRLQLAHLRESKVTDTKAQHLSATFNFRSTVIFNVPEPENDATDASQTLDPALGVGASATPDAATSGNAERPTREIRAHDTLINQPNDNPVLQRAVAKHIITALGNVDGSSWSVREMSRSVTDWTFQYICKNSSQAWMRQNSKNAAKVIVGESSGKDGQDPVILARPAFDCRGLVTIAFVKNSRTITVKFEHTPMHKTVAELAEIFKPRSPPTRAVAATRKDRKSEKRARPAGNGGENGEDGAKKNRKRKVASPDDPTAEAQAPKPKKPRPSRSKKKAGAAQAAPDAPEDAMLNLSPSEAARRRDEATRKLGENGIDPATLSQEQFDIFANQSPELQNESLTMLIKYGAERLRIVHPDKDKASSSSPAQANGGTPDGYGKKKKSRKKQFNEDGTPKIKKTRGSCQACRAKKTKCSKVKPECDECTEAGIDCYYPPEQKRKPIDKPDDVAQDDDPAEQVNADDSTTAAVDVTGPVAMPQTEPDPNLEEEASDLGSPGFNSSHPVAPSEMSHQQTDPSTFQEVFHDVYQPGTGGLTYPQAVPDDMAHAMDYSVYSSQLGQQQAPQNGTTYPQQRQQTSNASYPNPLSAPPAPAPAPEPVQPVQTTARPTRTKSPRSGARRSLPSGTSQNHNGYSDPAATGNGTTWQAANVPASTSHAYNSSSSPRQSRGGRRTAAPVNARAYDASQNEAMVAAATLSQAALQKTQPSPTTRTVSPFQTPTQAAAQAARAKSRQGQRAQSRATASPFQQQTSSTQPTAVDTAAIYNPSNSTEPRNLPSYDQCSRYNTATTQGGQASSRGGFDSFSQQSNSNNLSTSYSGYDAYNSRSQSSTVTPLAAPVTQGVATSYTNTAAPSPSNWSSSTGHRSTNSYGAGTAAIAAKSTYNPPASSTRQQQPANMQSINVRPQSTAHASRTSTPTSYSAQQQHTQQPRQQQQQPYNSYPAQSPSSSGQQPSQQQQQDWYGFGSGNQPTTGYGSSARGAEYGQSTQHRPAAMNIAGNTYQSMGDQELYDIFRAPPAH